MSEFIEDIVKRFKLANPEYCQFMGILESYGRVPSYKQATITNRIKELHQDISYIDSILTSNAIKKYSHIELKTLKSVLDYELFVLNDEKEYLNNPWVYLRPLSSIQGYYVARSYAPLETRIRDIIKTEEGVIDLITEAFDHLQSNLPRIKLELTFLRTKSTIEYLKDELIEEIIKVNNKDLIEEWSKINLEVTESVEKFIAKLKNDYLPKSDNKFALGEKKYLKMLEKVEGIRMQANKLLSIAEQDLERNYRSLQKIISEIGMEKFNAFSEECPTEENLIDLAKLSMTNSKEFLIEKDLVSMPNNDECLVKETPAAMRADTFAALSSANIAEDSDAKESYYYITPPNKDWTSVEKADYLKSFNLGSLEIITVHEVYPGHFLHDKYIKKQSPLIRLFGMSTAMIEGWAHYCEELVIEEGYNKIKTIQLQIGQLRDALVRNCRFVASVKMHCYGMSVEEAKNLFMEKVMAPEKAAEMEARRGTVDPMYLNYTLGKLIIQKLRKDYKKERGENYSLKEFHNKLLSYGGIPLPIIRNDMLQNPGSSEDLL